MQKLYRVMYQGQEHFVLAFTFGDALRMWRESKDAFAKADPELLAIAVPVIIGAAKKPKLACPPDGVAGGDVLELKCPKLDELGDEKAELDTRKLGLIR